jgi:hypothetical protein
MSRGTRGDGCAGARERGVARAREPRDIAERIILGEALAAWLLDPNAGAWQRSACPVL